MARSIVRFRTRNAPRQLSYFDGRAWTTRKIPQKSLSIKIVETLDSPATELYLVPAVKQASGTSPHTVLCHDTVNHALLRSQCTDEKVGIRVGEEIELRLFENDLIHAVNCHVSSLCRDYATLLNQ